MSNKIIDNINKWIHANCGRASNQKPYFNLVYGPSVTHREKCLKQYLYGSSVIAEEEVVQLVQKYRNVAPEQYLIEKLIVVGDDVVNYKGEDPVHYEALYVFFDDPLKCTGFHFPTIDDVQYFFHCFFSGIVKARHRDINQEQEDASDRAVARDYAYLDEKCPYMSHLSRIGQAVFMNDATQRPSSNYRIASTAPKGE